MFEACIRAEYWMIWSRCLHGSSRHVQSTHGRRTNPLPDFPARRESAIRLAALVAVTVALRHFGLPSRPIIAAENETVRKVIPTHRGVSSGRYEIKVAWRIAET